LTSNDNLCSLEDFLHYSGTFSFECQVISFSFLDVAQHPYVLGFCTECLLQENLSHVTMPGPGNLELTNAKNMPFTELGFRECPPYFKIWPFSPTPHLAGSLEFSLVPVYGEVQSLGGRLCFFEHGLMEESGLILKSWRVPFTSFNKSG